MQRKLHSLDPVCHAAFAMSEKVIEFFFDIGSPYSYLAATQVDGVAQRTGVRAWWRPFLLGGVFKASGNTTPAAVASKARWMVADLTRWAEHYEVPFRMSTHFPVSTLITQRAIVAAARLNDPEIVSTFARALFNAYWVQDRNVADTAVISDVAAALGLDGAAVVEMAHEAESKALLRKVTDEAVSRGAFGAPTLFVGDTMFWGNDRLILMEQMLSV